LQAGIAVLVSGVLLLWQFPYLPHARELVDLWKISEHGTTGFIAFLIATAMMTAGWLRGAWSVDGVPWEQVWLPIAVVTTAIVVVFVVVYPATAIDVYIYAARSHLFSDYGLNPSTALPQSLWDIDPYVRYASQEWSIHPSPYGPLWNGIAAPATAFDGEDIRTAVMLYKVLMACCAVATAWLVYDIAIAVEPRHAVTAALLWIWSPIVLWEGIANAHNDVVLALLLVAALWCWYRRHDGFILPLIGAAALLKVVAVMLIPAAIVAIVVRTGVGRRLWSIALQTTIVSLGVIWVAFVPYFDIDGTIDAIESQRGVWVTSPVVLFEAMNNEWGWGLDPRPVFDQISTLAIVLITAIGAVVAWRRPEALPRIAFEQLFWFLLLATSNLRPWYAIWIVALAVTIPMGPPLVRAVALSTGMLLSYGYSGWVQNWTEPEWLVRNAINLAIMLGPVLLALVWELTQFATSRGRQPAPAPTHSD
jgi:alpha-1,6-mannosyltransferase